MSKIWIVHGAFIVAVVAIGGLIGTQFVPGAWYDTLNQPSFTPPPWVFAPIWTVLYVLIGWVGARKFLYGGARALWWAQMVVNFIWTPIFFGAHSIWGGLAVIALLWLLILAFIVTEWRSDRRSAWLFVPYLAWVTLATAVNAGVAFLN